MGMFKNSEDYEASVAGFSSIFQDALAASPALWDQVAFRHPSLHKTENFDWIGDLPLVREWIGERQLKTLVARHFNLSAKEYENSITIKRTDIEDDTNGSLNLKISMMGRQHAKKKDALVFDFLTSGAWSLAGYDGVSLINASHPNEIGGTQTNTAAATALVEASFNAGRKIMSEFTDDYGDPIGCKADLLVYGPDNAVAAETIVNQKIQATSEENLNYKRVRLLESPRITGTHWFLLDTSQLIMPVVLVDRLAPEMEDSSLASAESLFTRGEYKYGGRMRMTVGPALWQLIYGNEGA